MSESQRKLIEQFHAAGRLSLWDSVPWLERLEAAGIPYRVAFEGKRLKLRVVDK